MVYSIATLTKQFIFDDWKNLLETTLICLQVFNRRRAGEIERITIENYNKKETITDNIEAGFIDNISNQSFEFAKQYVRITLRGKLGRTVSILLDPLSRKAVDLILKHRNSAGIPKSNHYIFSAPGSSGISKKYIRACPLLRKFALECGATIPHTLRGNKLRKHIATYTALLNVEEATVDKLANFLGHHKDIHKSIYRVSVPMAEITTVSKILLSAAGCRNEENSENNSFDNLRGNISSESESSSDESDNITYGANLVKKKISNTSCGKTKKCRWTIDEQEALTAEFGDISSMEKLPSFKECMRVVSENEVLCCRTPAQVKTFIDNKRKKGKKIKLFYNAMLLN
ncbi:uncharacterized protein LOC131800790 [Musca domestica]|uniref:Uncharacterized protein LOC131800790 n=1 Tax=Musca domestica TaxID=7370 RepID=A0ABM3ULR4_MUSDO|nr:uncharacterized protein LOC131800790 [Musca domestica]